LSDGGLVLTYSPTDGYRAVILRPTFTQPDPPPGATPTGSNVAVTPTDATTGQPAPVTITFGTVTGAGTTTVTSGTVGTSGSPAPPTGFRLNGPQLYFDIETTATFTGTATVCFTYNDADVRDESKLRILHRTYGGAWQDITTSHDTTTNKICGTTSSFSPFLLAENLPPAVTTVGRARSTGRGPRPRWSPPRRLR
jgi:hypothetical protein